MRKSISEKYKRLLADCDTDCRHLEKLHIGRMVCKKGCTACCMDFSIFPVEYFAIEEKIEGRDLIFNPDAGEGECPLLVGGLCAIYEYRPFICRSHGLPLLSMGDDGWELSYCELNFTRDAPGFDQTNTLAHDRYNSRLFMLNKEFIETLKDGQYSEFDLIPIRNLIL